MRGETEMMRLSRLLSGIFAAALVLRASLLNADTLDCKPNWIATAEKDPVVTIIVSVVGQVWQVTHIAASGKRYERAEQYDLRDVSDQNARKWEGTLIKHPFLKMVGQILSVGNSVTYAESLYDARKNGAKIMELNFACASGTLTEHNGATPSISSEVDKGAPPTQNTDTQNFLPIESAPAAASVGKSTLDVSVLITDCARKETIAALERKTDWYEAFLATAFDAIIAKCSALDPSVGRDKIQKIMVAEIEKWKEPRIDAELNAGVARSPPSQSPFDKEIRLSDVYACRFPLRSDPA